MKAKLLAGLSLLMILVTACDETTDGLGSSLTDNTAILQIATDSFKVSSRSIVADSVLSRSSTGYLGRIKDPETGTYITGDFMVQFTTLNEKVFPGKDSIESKINGEIVADSCVINLFYSDFYGDSLATMKLSFHEMAKPMEENVMYYSNFDPAAKGYLRENGIKIDKVYTLADQNTKDSIRKTTDYLPSIRIALNDPYTDKDGNTYNNYGTYVMRKYYEDPNNFKNPYQFVHKVCPGFYLKVKDGIGSMAYVSISWMNIYYKVKSNDTIYTGRTSFSGTEEVLQTTRVTSDKQSLAKLVAENNCTYVKSPAGIFTELTLPVDEIVNNHDNDTLNTAKIVLTRIQNERHTAYDLSLPTYLLMVPKDSLYSFFEKNSLPNNVTSYVKERDHTTVSTSTYYTNAAASRKIYKDSYTFDNISNLIRSMANAKKNGGSGYVDSHPNWNKVVLVPVSISTSTTSNNTQQISRVVNDMSITSLKLVGGSENPNGDITISVIYSKFSNR